MFRVLLFLSLTHLSCLLDSTQALQARQAASGPSFNNKIKHVVALMFENRSFDHFLGYLRENRSDINGCLPNITDCSCPLRSTGTDSSILIPVGPNAVYIQPGDPDHGVDGTTLQLYGTNVNSSINTYPALMNGFIESYSTHEGGNAPVNDSGKFIMQCFTPDTLPILSTLANEFGVYDTWFADVPGPTEPNRIFSWMGTCHGMEHDDHARLALGFPGDNIFELLDKYYLGNDNDSGNGIDIDNGDGEVRNVSKHETWRVYAEDAPTPIFVEYTRKHPENFYLIDQWFIDLKNNDLPVFSWIDPSYTNTKEFPSRDEHPDHDVRLGEQFLKNIYESLRSSDLWNDTLLMIFFDEHGGFFDHVSPPLAPNPDNINGTDFNFNRLGLRVPTVFISPWIKKGTIGTRPLNQNDNQYCHSSLIHTLREQFMPGTKSITKRDEWSKTFEDIINLDIMRNDCIKKLPNIPNVPDYFDKRPRIDKIDDEWWINGQELEPLSSFQKSLVVSTAGLCGVKQNQIAPHMINQQTAGTFLRKCMKQWMNV